MLDNLTTHISSAKQSADLLTQLAVLVGKVDLMQISLVNEPCPKASACASLAGLDSATTLVCKHVASNANASGQHTL